MLSIIVCSRDQKAYDRFQRSVRETVGIPHELIAVNNIDNKFSICQAYNHGAAEANYKYLCFVHEDVVFRTKEWGMKVVDHLKEKEIGLIGIAGSTYKSSVPSSWSSIPEYNFEHLIQHHKYQNSPSRKVKQGEDQKKSIPVVALDGVFMATRKEVFRQYKFDDTMLKGFHGYDIDYSLQVGQRYRLQMVFDILIEHFSEGRQGKEWMESTILVSEKWKSFLPRSVNKLPYGEEKKIFYKNLFMFIMNLKRKRYSSASAFRYMWRFYRFRFFDLKLAAVTLYKLLR